MSALFDDIIRANQPSGKIEGIAFGIVADTEDPLKLQRVQVLDMTKGGQFRSDWLFRLLPFTHYSPPVPKINDLVVIGYVDGDPHRGVYMGVITNNINKPVGADSDLTIVLGNSTISLDIAGNLTATVDTAKINTRIIQASATESARIDAPNITISGGTVNIQATSVKINGKDVVVVGGKTNKGDTIVEKGYG